MADDKTDPIASTAAFRAFSANGQANAEPARRRPSTLVLVTTILALGALVVGVLAFAL